MMEVAWVALRLSRRSALLQLVQRPLALRREASSAAVLSVSQRSPTARAPRRLSRACGVGTLPIPGSSLRADVSSAAAKMTIATLVAAPVTARFDVRPRLRQRYWLRGCGLRCRSLRDGCGRLRGRGHGVLRAFRGLGSILWARRRGSLRRFRAVPVFLLILQRINLRKQFCDFLRWPDIRQRHLAA